MFGKIEMMVDKRHLTIYYPFTAFLLVLFNILQMINDNFFALFHHYTIMVFLLFIGTIINYRYHPLWSVFYTL